MVLAIFLLFAACFFVFQYLREKKYKADVLDMKLQDYNEHMAETLYYLGSTSEETLNTYVREHNIRNLRVTLIRPDGTVFFDNENKDYRHLTNHRNRKEIQESLLQGDGTSVKRTSHTMKHDFFYSATYFPKQGFIIRTALPYDVYLVKSLRADKIFIWFAVVMIIALVVVLYRFVRRLSENINKLRLFATRADNQESLETEDLICFPNDELGEIAERIIKLYKRLKTTKEEQNVLKRQLTQNVAHELKTPVASILGYMETLTMNKDLSESVKHQFLDSCFKQAQRLSALLQDISTLNRLDDGIRTVSFEPINVSQIVENITQEVALGLRKRQMTVRNLLPQSVMISGNPSLVYSIFRNLMDNAINYAGEGRTITIEAQEEEQSWSFAFQDNGQGVKEEHLSRLFERFYRVDKGRSRKMGGTGLGLAIVKNAVLVHSGKIAVENLETGGLLFRFSLAK